MQLITKCRWTPLCLLATSLGLYGSADSVRDGAGDQGLTCVEELEVPRFATVLHAPYGGIVHAQLVVGQGGTVAELRMQGGTWHLQAEVELHLRELSKYSPSCAGQQVNLIFDFRVTGKDVIVPIVRTFFRQPNQFVILSQIPRPTITVIPVKPQSKQKAKKKKTK